MISQSLFKNPIKLRRCTGLTLEQFNELSVHLELLWDEAEEKRLSSLNPNRKRAIGAGHPYTLKTIKEKLFSLLLYYKTYSAFWLLGLIVGLDASNVCRLIQRLRPLLEKAADPELEVYLKKVTLDIQKGRKKISSFEELKKEFPEIAEILIDATEQQRQRPSQRPKKNKRSQKKYYSGKKKKHTLKTQIVVNSSGRILEVSKTYPGSIHDFEVFRRERTAKSILEDAKTYLDKGYTGVKKEHPLLNFLIPFKRNRWKKELSRSEKIYNTKLAKKRVMVEHVLAKLKKYRILSDIFRNRVKDYNQDFRNIASLINFRNFRLELAT